MANPNYLDIFMKKVDKDSPIGDHSKISIVKNDLYQFRTPEKKGLVGRMFGEGSYQARPTWTDMTRRFLKKGASVDLYALNEHEGAFEEISGLMDEFDTFGYFKIDHARLDHTHKRGDTGLNAERMNNYGFTLFQNPDAIWLERWHHPNSDYMNNVVFGGPNAVKHDREAKVSFRSHVDLLKLVRESSSQVPYFADPNIGMQRPGEDRVVR